MSHPGTETFPLASAAIAESSAGKLSDEERGYGAVSTKHGCVQKASRGTPVACWFILVVELCERLAFYTFNGTLAFFFERAGFSLVGASGISASMVSLCYCWPLAASWLADVVLGRFQTIFWSAVLYAIGCSISAFATWPDAENVPLFFVGVLGLIPPATAGIKANLMNFGADQYDENDPDELAARERFFYIFYLSINVGALFSYGFFTTFATGGGLGVPMKWGYLASYSLAALFMVAAAAIFLVGRGRYRYVPVQKSSALCSVTSMLTSAMMRGSRQATSVIAGFFLLATSISLSVMQAFLKDNPAMHVIVLIGFFCAVTGMIAVIVPCLDAGWLAEAKSSFDGSLEEHSAISPRTLPNALSYEDVKCFLEIMPALVLGTMAFNALYNCMAFWYQQQACQMDVRLGGLQIAGSFFNVADCMAIILVTPWAVDWVNPLLEQRFPGRFGTGARYGMGMFFGVLSVLLASGFEIIRRGSTVLSVTSQCAPPGIQMSSMHAGWMLLPYFLMGVGEIYCMPTLMYYAYSQSPPPMRTLAAAVGFGMQAVSSAVFALLLDVLRKSVPNDLNHGNLEVGYMSSILLSLTLFCLLLRVLR